MKKILFILVVLTYSFSTLASNNDRLYDSLWRGQLSEMVNSSFMEFIKQIQGSKKQILKDYSANDSILWNRTTYIDHHTLPPEFKFLDTITSMGFKQVVNYELDTLFNYGDPLFRKYQRVVFMSGPKFYNNTTDISIEFVMKGVRVLHFSNKYGVKKQRKIHGLGGVNCIWRYSCEKNKWILIKSEIQ